MIRAAVLLFISAVSAASLEEDLKDLRPEETQRNLHRIIQSHEGYNFGGIRYPEEKQPSRRTGHESHDSVYRGKDEGDYSDAYYGRDERDHNHAYYGKDERDHGHSYYGKHEAGHGDGHHIQGHHDTAGYLSKGKKQGHQSNQAKYHEKKSYERDRGYHYEKAYAYDKIRIHEDKSNYHQSHGSHYDNHAKHKFHDKGHHGGQSYMFFRKMGRSGYDKYGNSLHQQDGYQNGLYDNGAYGYGVLIKHTKDGHYSGYY